MLLFMGVFEMRIIDWKTLKTMVPYCRQHIARLEQVGKFPKKVRLGNGPRSRCGWVLEEVEAWIEARMSDRTLIEGAVSPVEDEIALPPVPKRIGYYQAAE